MPPRYSSMLFAWSTMNTHWYLGSHLLCGVGYLLLSVPGGSMLMSRCSCLASVRVLMAHKHSCQQVCCLYLEWDSEGTWPTYSNISNPTYSPNYEESEHHPLELPLLGRSCFIPQYSNHSPDDLSLNQSSQMNQESFLPTT